MATVHSVSTISGNENLITKRKNGGVRQDQPHQGRRLASQAAETELNIA